jgi:hypothetical protein
MKKTVTLEQEDLDSLHDTVLEALELDLDNEQILDYWNKLPEHLRDEAEYWGIDDSVVRDNIYEYLTDNRKEFI